MAYINRSELDSSIQEIKQQCASYQSFLSDISDKVSQLNYSYANFVAYDGCDVAGSLREIEGTSLFVFKKKKVDRIVISSSDIESYCNRILYEKEELDNALAYILQQLDSMTESLEVIAIYLLQVESCLEDGTSVSFADRLKSVSQLMKDDKENGYEFLHSMPVLEEGEFGFNSFNQVFNYSGKYLRYFNEYGIDVFAPLAKIGDINFTSYADNEIEQYSELYTRYYVDIMKCQEKFTDLHKAALREQLGTIILEDSDSSNNRGASNVGFTTSFGENEKCTINMNMQDWYFSDLNNADMYGLLVDSYTHEAGHVLDRYLGKQSGTLFYSDGSGYSKYYSSLQQVPGANTGDDVGTGALCDYAFDSPQENFAESVTEYYENYMPNANGYGHYSVSDLETIEFKDNVTSYDVFDSILRNGNMDGIDLSS